MKLLKVILFLILVPSACCEFCKDDAPTYFMDQDFKDFSLFPVGSHWIYAEELSDEYDSVYLYQQEVRINDSQKIYFYSYEQFDQSLGSTFFRDTLIGGSSIERSDLVFVSPIKLISMMTTESRIIFGRLL